MVVFFWLERGLDKAPDRSAFAMQSGYFEPIQSVHLLKCADSWKVFSLKICRRNSSAPCHRPRKPETDTVLPSHDCIFQYTGYVPGGGRSS